MPVPPPVTTADAPFAQLHVRSPPVTVCSCRQRRLCVHAASGDLTSSPAFQMWVTFAGSASTEMSSNGFAATAMTSAS